MTNLNRTVKILVAFLLCFSIGQSGLFAQETGFILSGKILESGSGLPLQQAVVSIVSSGESVSSDAEGVFSIEMPSPIQKILVNYPGFFTSEFYTKGDSDITVYLMSRLQKSSNEVYSSSLEGGVLRDATNAVTLITKSDFEKSSGASFDETLSGKVAGLNIIEHSGMPGHSTWMNLRGVSSIFGRNAPIMFIDGMIHEINYPNNSRIEGHILNPLDIVDMNDIVDISVIKSGEGQLGSAGSNGVIYVNTEQKEETSASILVKMYGGMSMAPPTQDVLGANAFKDYFNSLLEGEGYSLGQMITMYPWLYGGYQEYYRYNNNTNWQGQFYQPAALQKYYLFLKGGDDIATYNISTSYQRHGGPYDQWRYSRYNLRLNGKINITNKFSVTPNTKLSLSDTYLSNMGPSAELNPVISSLLKPPIMAPNERSMIDGSVLYPYDDVGVFNVSNPAVLTSNALGSDRSFQLLTSVKLKYIINNKLSISNTLGTSVNNDRVNIFIPEIGVVQNDSSRNSPQDMTTEFRSTQNHLVVNYNTPIGDVSKLDLKGGMRYTSNSYKNSQGIDLNTPSDDFRSLDSGAEYLYLRENYGEVNYLKWVSYFADATYSNRDKYYLRASVSVDASSAFNKQNRYNVYPSLFAAWRLSSEDYFNSKSINDLKLRASYSLTGNMFSNIYQYSKLTYTGRRYGGTGVVVRDYNPNENLSAEKKSTGNIGLDMSFGKRAYSLHLDYYMSYVHNLIINQMLPYNFGFTDYYDNGGVLAINGIEFAADGKINLGRSKLILDATVTKQSSKISSLDFLSAEGESITKEVYGAEYVAQVGSPINAFYGYATEGIYNTDAEAGGMIGPKGKVMGAGDVIFTDMDDNNIINELDKQIIGDPNPDLFGSLTATLALKKLQFSALFTYSLGNDIYNFVRYKTTSMDTYANQSTEVTDRWVEGSTNATLPRAAMGDPSGNNVFSDRWIESGSYLRFKQFTISYNTSRIFGMQREATFYVTGTNLFTLTNYSGFDPETMYLNDPYFMGIDYGKIPLATSVIFGIKLSL